MAQRCKLPFTVESFVKNQTSPLHNCSLCDDILFSVKCINNMKVPALTALALCVYLQSTVTAYEAVNRNRCERTFFSKLYLLPLSLGTLFAAGVTASVYGAIPPNACAVYSAAAFVAYTLSTMAVHTVFWARQRRFYSDPLFHESQTKALKWISKYVIVGVYLTTVSAALVLNSRICHVPMKHHCAVLSMNEISVLSSTVVTVFNFIFKGTFLYLTIRPLARSNLGCMRSDLNPPRSKDIRRMILRLTVCMFLSFLGALLCTTSMLFISRKGLCVGFDVIAVVALWICNVSTVCSYADGAQRLNPMAVLRGARKPSIT